jgi:thiol-disulfide isomerase/thioredoxin
MNDRSDADADDLFVDHCLQQELGGAVPPDLARRVGGASAQRLAQAATAVDVAATMATLPPARSRMRTLWAAAAAVAILGLVAWLVETATARTATPASSQALVDRFHRVMPQSPAMLRDETWRRRVADQAIPAIRAILERHRQEPDSPFFADRVLEFEVYGAVLGDEVMQGDLRRRAADGDEVAAGELAVVLATLTSGDERAGHLERLGVCLRRQPAAVWSLVRSLDAADLTPDETQRLAAAVEPSELQRYLLAAAERSAASPRRLLGTKGELFGRLVDGRPFRTANLRGHVVLVYFWATWCRPSLDFVERVRRLHARHPELAIVGVSCDHDPAAVRDHLDRHGDEDWFQFFDANRPGWHEFAFAWHVQRIPFALVLDRDGVVREVDAEADLDGAIARQLAR